MPRKPIEVIGKKFGRLTVLSEFHKGDSTERTYWVNCLCDCGNTHAVRKYSIYYNKQKSCGCLAAENVKTINRTHGQTGTKTHNAYRAAKSRCTNKNNKKYKYWGGRGIEFRFSSFEDFLDCIGHAPPGFSLDRIDTNGHYEPGNVRWAKMTTQAENKRTSYFWFIDGVKFDSVREACEKLGINRKSVYNWCQGYSHNQKKYPPKPNCYAVLKY